MSMKFRARRRRQRLVRKWFRKWAAHEAVRTAVIAFNERMQAARLDILLVSLQTNELKMRGAQQYADE